ncbi:MAG: flavodoxin domain-containing protein [Gemmatimonadota bacterium]|jgi:menaquinone-dependent protoporphyrinogen IX oxidase
MHGAIIFSGQYGSTEQYSKWISEETGLPVFPIDDPHLDPASFDFLVLGSSVVFYKATIRRWVKSKWSALEGRPLILFTVSGAAAGPKLDAWVTNSFPPELLARMRRFALRGRLRHEDVGWWLRLMLRIGALMNRDPQARLDEMRGFDYMDRSSIEPIVRLIEQYKSEEGPTLAPVASNIQPEHADA